MALGKASESMGKEEMPWKSVSQLLGSITAKHLRTGDLKFQQRY